MIRNRISLVVGVGIALVLLLRMTVYTVQDYEVAVVLTFGEATSEHAEAGPGLKWPWPVQRVQRFDRRMRVLKAPLEELATDDGRAILVGTFCLWQIQSAKRFVEKAVSEESAEQKLLTYLRSHQSAAISATRFDQLVSTDRKKLRYREVEARMLKGVRADAADLGIEVVLVGIRRLGLPQEATDAVFERMIEDRRRLADEALTRGEREGRRIRNLANKSRKDKVSAAKNEARGILADAEKAARPHYARLARDPELAGFLLKLEALKTLLKGDKVTVVFSPKDPPFDLLDSQRWRSVAPVKTRD